MFSFILPIAVRMTQRDWRAGELRFLLIASSTSGVIHSVPVMVRGG